MSYYFKKGQRGKGRKERENMRSSPHIQDLKKFTLCQSKMKFKLNILLSEENKDQSQDFLLLGFNI